MKTSTETPNILLIFTDQMRSTAVGCAGVEAVITPHLDALAAQGTRFSNAIANTPACTPARATLLTGKHTMRHGLTNNDMQLGHDHKGLAHCLNELGYDCGWIGKWHLDGVNRGAYIPSGPRRQGFDSFWAGAECNHAYMAGYYYDDETREPVWFDDYEPTGQTDLALEFLGRRQDSARPFFLTLSWGAPHCPYEQVPKRHKNMYNPETMPIMATAEGAKLLDRVTAFGDSPKPLELTDAEHERRKRDIIRDYYAHITAMDENVGRLMAALDRLNLTGSTLVIFSSDHGDMLFNHNRGWKGKPWRESVGIPLIMRWPGEIPAGRVTDGMIGLVDLMPTLVSMVGGTPPDGLDGTDLATFVRGDDDAAAPEQYINYPISPTFFTFPAWRGVVTRTHTYAAVKEGHWLLYNDVDDPLQTRNLVVDAHAHAIRDDLAARTRQWMARTDDDFPEIAVLVDACGAEHSTNVIKNPPLPDLIVKGQHERLEAWRRGERG